MIENLTNVRVWVLQRPDPNNPVILGIRWEQPYDDYDYVEPFEDYDWCNPEHQKIGLQKVYWKECILEEIKTLR